MKLILQLGFVISKVVKLFGFFRFVQELSFMSMLKLIPNQTMILCKKNLDFG